jgi:hypothetical protein
MAQKLYLVRVNLERFVGPMTIADLRKAYRKMSFGLQDEVAASNRAWIPFDDLGRIKKYYPELLELVQRDMLAGWAGGGDVQIGSPARKSNLFTVMLLLISALGAALAFYMVRGGQLASRFMIAKDPYYANAEALMEAEKWSEFNAYMERYRSAILKEIQSDRDEYLDWLPSLRALAFTSPQEAGWIPGKIWSQDEAGAPRDCGQSYWRTAWKSSARYWKDFIDGNAFPNQDWARVLLWDPYWIKARQAKGWVKPRNYHEACLSMAFDGLRSVSGLSKRDSRLRNILEARLIWQINIVKGRNDEAEISMSGNLWALSCTEDPSGGDCLTHASLNGDWGRILRNRALLGTIKQRTRDGFGEGEVGQIKKLVERWRSSESFPGQNFDAERAFFLSLISEGGNLEKALPELRRIYPSVEFLNL